MLTVKTPDQVLAILEETFPAKTGEETVPLEKALGRVLSRDIAAGEHIPGFHRSTVDGYALRGADTFGCSAAIPAILPLAGEVVMGRAAPGPLAPGSCVAVPTGGMVPEGADAVVMLEQVEDYGDGTVGVCAPVAPGMNMIFRGDDVVPGRLVLPSGRRLQPQDLGALAALGAWRVPVRKRPVAGILSTGDELVPVGEAPGPGQVRDVNSVLLGAVAEEAGADCRLYGIIPDREEALARAIDTALGECDLVMVSGGSSVGTRDIVCRVLEDRGRVLLHGIAMKPGKPTILGEVAGKAVLGLPGNPVAAFFTAWLFGRFLVSRMMGRRARRYTIPARLAESVEANHGRSLYSGAILVQEGEEWLARPIRGKSGLITTLAATNGFFHVPRDCEGLPKGARVEVSLYTVEQEE